MTGERRPSLLITGLPRSLTTAVYHHARAALGASGPLWAPDGELLNFDNFSFLKESDAPERHFVREGEAHFEPLLALARQLTRGAGQIIKVVTQPYVAARLLGEGMDPPVRVLRVERPIADVAMAMLGRGWTYPARCYPSLAVEEGLIRGLIDARRALAAVDGWVVSFEDLLLEPEALGLALAHLYPEAPPGPIFMHDDEFLRRRAEVLARRRTAEYRRLAELALEIEAGPRSPAPARAPLGVAARRQPILLAIGDAVAPTGFARVLDNVLAPALADFEVHQVGIKFGGGAHGRPWTIHPCPDMRGTELLARLCRRLEPDLVFMVNDIWMLDEYLEALRQLPQNPRTLAYCPVDAAPVAAGHVSRLAGLHRLVAYNEFGREALERAAGQGDIGRPSWGRIEVIPHGVDTGVFFPLEPLGEDLIESRRRSRESLFPADPALRHAFIVLNANRNQPRKRIDITVAGFAKFAAGRSDARLYLHMGTEDLGWDLRALAARYGIANKLLISTDSRFHPNLPLADLNRVFNACDVGVNTSEAEGWGLVSFEHAATGAAQIVPRHSGPGTLWQGCAELLEVKMTLQEPKLLSDVSLVGSDDLAAALARLYEDRDLLEKRSRQAYRLATDESLQWRAISSRWRKVFLEELAIRQEAAAPGPSASSDGRAALAPLRPESESKGEIQ